MNGLSENFAANEQRPRRGATPHDACAPREGWGQTAPETARPRPGLRRVLPSSLPVALRGLAPGLPLVFAGLLAVPGETEAQGVTTLVSDLNQGNDETVTFTVPTVVAQQFTTNSNTGGHTLAGVDIDSEYPHGAPLSVSAQRTDSMGAPVATGTPRVGEALTAGSGTIGDADGRVNTTGGNATGRPAITLYVTVGGVQTIPHALNPFVAQMGYKLVVTDGTIDDPDGRPVWCDRKYPDNPNDLSCTNGPGDDYVVQWIQVDGNTETVISGVMDDKEYTVRATDLGKRLKVKMSFTDNADNRESRQSLKSPVVVRKEQECDSRPNSHWCSKMWAWARDISSGRHNETLGTYYGYQAIGRSGVGVLVDRTIKRGDETLNLVGEVGMADYDNSRDKITLGLTAQRWLPDGTVFNFGGG